MLIAVKVKEIAFDFSMNPVVLLVDQNEIKVLPIWVGPLEGHSIALGLKGLKGKRPVTHDLIKDIFDLVQVSVTQVVINDVRDNTFYAEIYLRNGKNEMVVDARPSDAIALALRTETPVYITEKVAEHTVEIKDLIDEEQQQQLRELLEGDQGEGPILH